MDTLPPNDSVAISSESGPFEQYGELVFDDDPLEPQLQGLGDAVPPTPADAIALWRLGTDRSDATARAAAAILVHSPTRLDALPQPEVIERCLLAAISEAKTGTASGARHAASLLAALGALAEVQGRFSEAEKRLREALATQERCDGPDHRETDLAAARLAKFLERTGNSAQAAELLRARSVDRLLRNSGRENYVPLRLAAYELFLAGRYSEAEMILRHLLDCGFDLPGTHCHIARLCLLTNRDAVARTEIAAAWKSHVGAAKYIELRILYFNALFALLDGGDGREPLRAIAAGLRDPGAHNTWTIQPMIKHLAPRLSAEQLEIMAVLGHALSDSGKLGELETLPAWQQMLPAAATAIPPAASPMKEEAPPNDILQ